VKVFGRRPSRTFPPAPRPASENLQGMKPRGGTYWGRCRALSMGIWPWAGHSWDQQRGSVERWGWRCSSRGKAVF
jgi:hypothetical protein